MNRVMKPNRERPPLSRRTYALLALGFFAFVVYGSLVPFHYHAQSWAEALVRWDEVCRTPVGIHSLSDWTTNVLLFVPAGFLLMAVVAVDRPLWVGLLAAPAVLALCMAFSACVEFSQLFFPPRDSSLSDIAANTLGAASGILTWLACGQPLTGWLRRMWTRLAERGLSTQLLPAYLVFLFFVHAIPLDLTIRPADLYHKYKDGRVQLVPFVAAMTNPDAFIRKTIWTVLLFVPVGVLLARLPGPGWCKGRSWPRALAAGFVLAGLVEFMKLFVWSRYCTSGDVIIGGLAVFAGWRAALAWQRRPFDGGRAVFQPGMGLPDLRWFLLIGWFGILLFLNWQPFDFIGDPAVVMQRLHRMSWLPFADYQATTAEHAFEEALHKIVAFLPLGGLLAWALGRMERGRSVAAVVLAGGLVALFLEVGQLFLRSRYASVTDVLIETGGVWFGCRIVSQLGKRIEEPQPLASVPLPHGRGSFVSGRAYEYRR